MTNERQELLAQLETAGEEIASTTEQLSREIASSSKNKRALSAQLEQLNAGLALSKAETSRLEGQLESVRQQALIASEQTLSQQRRNNKKLVGLGGKLENVVFMVDISKSMQNGKGPNGVVLKIGFRLLK